MQGSKRSQKLEAARRLLAEHTVSNIIIYEEKNDEGQTEIKMTSKGSFVQLMGLLECMRINMQDDFRTNRLSIKQEDECPT